MVGGGWGERRGNETLGTTMKKTSVVGSLNGHQECHSLKLTLSKALGRWGVGSGSGGDLGGVARRDFKAAVALQHF